MVSRNPKSGILFSQTQQSKTQKNKNNKSFWLDGNAYWWFRESNTLENYRASRVTQGIAGSSAFKANDCRNVASFNLSHIFAFIGVHADNTPDTLFLASGAV